MDIHNKRKSFIGKSAPLGYVAGLGRGYDFLSILNIFNVVKY